MEGGEERRGERVRGRVCVYGDRKCVCVGEDK